MQLKTFTFHEPESWSVDSFPPLDSPQTLVLVFAAPKFYNDPDPIRELKEATPNSHLVGCSTAGEIFGKTINDDSLSVAMAQFDHTALSTTTARVQCVDQSYSAGEKIAQTLYDSSLKSVLILSDGINVNGSELLRGLNQVLPTVVTVTGGLAGDGTNFGHTWVIQEGEPQSGLVSAVGFYGDHLQIGHGSKGGWDIFGPERRVTRSKGNVLYELDGMPALQLYKKYLGELAAGLPATALRFPLAVREASNGQKSVVRTILAVDEEANSMVFAGDIPQGHLAQLMKANYDRLIDGASIAAQRTKQGYQCNPPTLAIAISCVGRRLVLGERTEEELEATLDILPKDTHQVGFYSYGEISPHETGYCDLHNQTMTLTTICEATPCGE